ncbi:tyrosine-protein phosphatase 99A-like isoform X2 [Uranotaenia lowii]|uniref:tyrosine-protein phosphatase 99A-like isoform X2 n=1 Tax=Uranotaenia lowii TaxID=190385 RepID=UPI00247A1D37|nr:tyrosine-protein phosphatase 99A-like isoform X2 [Uranotaenia lowii]XP_055614525.1 tyrosine-protein phosphatase 99A-like isoform X2 [Uranotaenia lowii]XP_055614587.1 tyrosine-protein phosphatase 99A-like isoform X2 [Uranotaenia lowii]XP_055614646.1 tyrosine-protein phosphatase 99A-like isoform X2 [Uranotaenia lowii]XP_055614703.1 tyrosine-protein phosphatase 99A-like isoform X2 [Uranotaenia lowii]XP_055614707.1 tyrosine-protein phosphatase 99A-like isoform X2 [Uranotaenia lowii]
MKSRPLATKTTWLALTALLFPVLIHHPRKPPPLVSAIPTVNFTGNNDGFPNDNNNNGTHTTFSEPEIPYEELEEPRVLPLQSTAALAPQSDEPGINNNNNLKKQLQPENDGVKVAFPVPSSNPSGNVVPVLQLVLEEPESHDEPFTTTQGCPTFSADDNFVPSKPLNLSVLEVTSTTIKITWREPEKQNGAIHGYRVYYVHQNQTLLHLPILKAKEGINSVYTYTLSNLKPYTDYKMIVAAFTKKCDGEPSEVHQRTDISGPSAPKVVNLTCHSLDALFFGWRIPATYYNTIDYYIVSYRNELHSDLRDIRITANASIVETSMIIPNLTSNMVYEVKVRAASISVINPKQLILGSYSEPKKISLQPNCEKLPPASQRQSFDDYNLAVLAGIVVSCFGLLLVVLAFLLWKKCFHAAYYYLDDPPPSSQGTGGGGSHGPSAAIIDWESPSEVAGEVRSSISVAEFAKHVASLHADGDIGFSKEYEAIQGEALNDEYPSEYSQHPDNKGKNRYLNVIAYDHSRVHLRQIPGQKKHLDYINANFIDGYQKSKAFIATQGPLPGTFDCFWRMIWEQRVAIIVMITNLVERGRRKCDMYWPKDGVETYGIIQVKLIREEVMATYTVRTFQIKHTKLKKKKASQMEKMVYQYHYTNWPDHGTPDHPLPVINFVKKSTTANPSDAGPIVVHCSAGVGRTGTYIVLDAILKQIESKSMLNVFGFLRYIRAQRNYMVQTEEQYIFIHDALVEAIDSGETNIKVDAIGGLVNNIDFIDGQYKLITSYQPKEINLTSALKPVNAIKNRSSLVPLEGSRVHLTPKPGVEGSDYINATWLHGFRRLRDFIVTQHPLIETFKDFWQMVWDHNAQTVVLLSSADNMSFLQFWPIDSEPIESDYYRIRMVSEAAEQNFVVRNFVIQSIQDDYELTVRMFENPMWPDMANPRSIYDFVVRVHERCAEYRNGPIVIVDRYGGFQACQFCCISSLAMQLEQDQTANVYTYAKLYHNKRPGIWSSYEDIRQIYRILSYMPKDLGLLKCTELRTEFDDAAIMTATPDLYSKICSNGSINTHLNSGTVGSGGVDGTGNGGPPNAEAPTGNGTNNGGPTTTIQNGGTVIVKMNGEDNDELSVVVATSNHLNLDHNQT